MSIYLFFQTQVRKCSNSLEMERFYDATVWGQSLGSFESELYPQGRLRMGDYHYQFRLFWLKPFCLLIFFLIVLFSSSRPQVDNVKVPKLIINLLHSLKGEISRKSESAPTLFIFPFLFSFFNKSLMASFITGIIQPSIHYYVIYAWFFRMFCIWVIDLVCFC